MSDEEWFFDFKYGPMLEEPVGNGLIMITIDETDFKRKLMDFIESITSDSKRNDSPLEG